jgi:cold shock CspA family protein
MAKSQAASTKNEKEKLKQKKREEKENRKAERRASAKQGASLEDMLAYVDEDGNITNTPPDPTKKKVVREEDIVLGSRNIESQKPTSDRIGRVTFFNTAKGYGFIKDEQSQESIFVHANSLTFAIKENDRVSFETQPGQKGPMAVNVKKV